MQLRCSIELTAPWGQIPPVSIVLASQCLDTPTHPFTAGKQPKWLYGFSNSKARLCSSSKGFGAVEAVEAVEDACPRWEFLLYSLYAVLKLCLLQFLQWSYAYQLQSSLNISFLLYHTSRLDTSEENGLLQNTFFFPSVFIGQDLGRAERSQRSISTCSFKSIKLKFPGLL